MEEQLISNKQEKSIKEISKIKLQTNDLENPSIEGEIIEPKWKDDFCGCFNNIYPSMLCTIGTPIIYISQMHEKINNEPNTCGWNIMLYSTLNIISFLINSRSKLASSFIFYLVNIYFLSLAAYIRTKTRQKYNIPGSRFEDICLTAVLTPCAIAQTGRTLYQYDKICDEQKSCTSG